MISDKDPLYYQASIDRTAVQTSHNCEMHSEMHMMGGGGGGGGGGWVISKNGAFILDRQNRILVF